MIKIAQNAQDKVNLNTIKLYNNNGEYIECRYCDVYKTLRAISVQRGSCSYLVSADLSYDETYLFKIIDNKIKYPDPYENVLHAHEHTFVIYDDINNLHNFDYLSCLFDSTYHVLWKTIGPFPLKMKFKNFIKNEGVQYILQHAVYYEKLIIELSDKTLYISV